jgi:hypothetical protein
MIAAAVDGALEQTAGPRGPREDYWQKEATGPGRR